MTLVLAPIKNNFDGNENNGLALLRLVIDDGKHLPSCYTSYCMRFHFVILITLMRFDASSFEVFGLGESHFYLVG
jgi:hypothetical protein